MRSISSIKILLRVTFCCLLVLSTILVSHNSYAFSGEIYDGVRDYISYKEGQHTCDTGSIEFEPFSNTNRDIQWEFSNKWCIGFMGGVGLTMMITGKSTKFACQAINSQAIATGMTIIEETEEELLEPEEPITTPKTAAGLITRTKRCASRTREYLSLRGVSTAACLPPSGGTPACVAAQADALNAQREMTSCCYSVGSHTIAIGAAVAALAIVYDTAKIAYENARICGAEWNTWRKIDNSWNLSKGTYQKCVYQLFSKNGDVDDDCDDTSDEKYKINDDLERTGQAKASLKNKYYREYIYGGIEYKDKGNGHCSNPASWNSAERKEYLGYDDNEQRYYMTGANTASVYNCRRFLPRKGDVTPEDMKSVDDAYDCCVNRSETSICIESKSVLDIAQDTVDGGNKYDQEFCTLGSKCSVANVWYEIYGSQDDPTYICAKTYSVCPYNHPLGGGTEQEEFYPEHDMEHIGERKNFCQYMKHCVKIPIKPYFRRSDLKGGYISSACRNLKGDAQNFLSYTSQLVPVNSHNFTAPIAQCFKETMENIFLNKAGHSQCVDNLEDPVDDVCTSGYIYRKGYDLGAYNSLHEDSFFIKMQNSLQGFIKIALVLSVVAFGFMILIGVPKNEISKKVIVSYILKMALVMYFAVGDGWQFGFMDGVLNSSNYLSELTFRPDEKGIEVNDGSGNIDKSNLDGCQFPRFNYADDNFETKYDNPAYPPGKRYLRIWDTLDCKIARALGYAPGATIPNLLMMFLAGFFTSGYGIIFVVATFFIAFLMISIAVRALHIFLLSTTAVVILMYVSPIMITLKMFKRTENMFEKWWKQLLGFTLQPMILFAYLGILITFIDSTIIGEVKFTGTTRYDSVEQVTVFNDFSGDAEKGILCTGEAANSIYCIFNDYKIGTNNDLAIIGIGLPVLLLSMDADKIQSLIVSALLLFIFMSFLDQITAFARTLVGGGSLASDWGGMAGMAKGMGALGNGLSAAGERAVRGAGNLAGPIARKGIEAAKSLTKKNSASGGAKSGISKDDKKLNPAQDNVVDSSDAIASDAVNRGGVDSGVASDAAVNRDDDVAVDAANSGATDAATDNAMGEPDIPADPDAENRPKEEEGGGAAALIPPVPSDAGTSTTSNAGSGTKTPISPHTGGGTPTPPANTNEGSQKTSDNEDKDAIAILPLPGGAAGVEDKAENKATEEKETPDAEPNAHSQEKPEKEEAEIPEERKVPERPDAESNAHSQEKSEKEEAEIPEERKVPERPDAESNAHSQEKPEKEEAEIPEERKIPERPDAESNAHSQEKSEKEEAEIPEEPKVPEKPDVESDAHSQEEFEEEEPEEEDNNASSTDMEASDNIDDDNAASDISSLSEETSSFDDSSRGGNSRLLEATVSSSAKETTKSNAINNQEPFYAGGSISSQDGKSESSNEKESQNSRRGTGSVASKKSRASTLRNHTVASRGQRVEAKVGNNQKPLRAGGVVNDGGGKQRLAGKKANIKTPGGGHAKSTILSASRQKPDVPRKPTKPKK